MQKQSHTECQREICVYTYLKTYKFPDFKPNLFQKVGQVHLFAFPLIVLTQWLMMYRRNLFSKKKFYCVLSLCGVFQHLRHNSFSNSNFSIIPHSNKLKYYLLLVGYIHISLCIRFPSFKQVYFYTNRWFTSFFYTEFVRFILQLRFF